MKTYKDFMVECSQVDESSLSRIKSKSDKGGMAILSGSRGDKSKKENKAMVKKLRLKNVVTLSPLVKRVREHSRKQLNH